MLDALDQWKGPQPALLSENDVFLLDESTTPPQTAGVQEKTVHLEPVTKFSESVEGGNSMSRSIDLDKGQSRHVLRRSNSGLYSS